MEIYFKILRRSGAVVALALMLAALAGCGSERQLSFIEEPPLPQVLQGPGSWLLLEQGEFSSVVALAGATSTNGPVMGKVFGDGTNLLCALDAVGPKRKGAGGFIYIWAPKVGRGYLLCEVLQGYAPIVTDTLFTNVTVRRGISGVLPEGLRRECEAREVAGMANGAATTVDCAVAREGSVAGFPLWIGAGARSATFTRVKREAIPAELFGPPAGFTRYASVQAMMSELGMRQVNTHRKPNEFDLDAPLGQPKPPKAGL